MLNLKTLKPFFVGFLLGVLVLGSGAGLFAKSLVDGAKTDYSDEATKLNNLASEAKDPLLQKDYVITGLILSDKFNEFLEEGVQEGLWTEDFLIQFGGDYSIPILLKNYSDIIVSLASTDKAKAVAKTVSKVADVVTKVKLQLELVGPKIVDLVQKLKDPNLKEDAIAQIKETVFTILQNAGVTGMIANILNKLHVFKFKVKDSLSSFERVIAKVKETVGQLKELIGQLKDPALKDKALAQIKEIVFNILQNMGITGFVANLLNKLEIFKFKVRDSLSSFERVIAKVKETIVKLKDPELKDKVLAQIKESVFNVLQSMGITAKVANLLNNLHLFKFKVRDSLSSFKHVIAKVKETVGQLKESIGQLKDPALKAKAIAQIKEIVFNILQNMGITAKIADFLNKLEVFKFKVRDSLNSFEHVFEKIKESITKLKDPALKDEVLAQIKANLFTVLHNLGITAKIADFLNKLEVFKFKVRDSLNSFEHVFEKIKELIAKLKDPALKDEVLAQIKANLFTVLQNAGITAFIANILNQIGVLKFKVQDTLESFKQVISALKDPALKAKVISEIKELINDKLASLGIQAKIDQIINQVKELINDIKNVDIDGIKTHIVTIVKGLVIAKLASLGIQEKIDQIISQLKELISNILDFDVDAIKAQIIAIAKELINDKLASLGIQEKIDQIISQVKELINKITNFDIEGLKADIIASIQAILAGKVSDVQALIDAKIDELIAAIKDKLNPSAIEAMLVAFIASHSDAISAKISQFITENQDAIRDAIMNVIMEHIDLGAIQVAIDNINNIIDRLEKLEEQMPEIKAQIEEIIDSFNNLIDILNSIDINGIEDTINSVVDQVDAIFDQIDEIASVLGNASAVINAIVSQEDVEKDDWDFIPALKTYDDSLNAVNLPKSLYTKLNVLEPIINVLTLDIDYTYTPDDGIMVNGNSAVLTINHVNVGKESSTNLRDVIDAPIEFGGVIAGTLSGFLPILNDNI